MAYYSNQVGPALAGLGGSILQNAQTVYQMQNRAEANRTDRMIQEAALARQQKLGQREDDLFKMQYGEALDAMKRPQKILGEGGFINNITTLAHLTVPPKDTSAPDKDQPGQRQTPAAGMALIDKFGAVLGAKYDPAKNAFVRNDGSFVSELEFRKAAPQLAGLYAANFDISKGLRDAGTNAFIRFQNGEIDQQQFEKIKQDIYAKAADPVWNIQRREMQLQFLQPFRGPEADAARQRLKREINDYLKIIAEQQGAEADRRWEREKLGIQHQYKLGEIKAGKAGSGGAAGGSAMAGGGTDWKRWQDVIHRKATALATDMQADQFGAITEYVNPDLYAIAGNVLEAQTYGRQVPLTDDLAAQILAAVGGDKSKAARFTARLGLRRGKQAPGGGSQGQQGGKAANGKIKLRDEDIGVDVPPIGREDIYRAISPQAIGNELFPTTQMQPAQRRGSLIADALRKAGHPGTPAELEIQATRLRAKYPGATDEQIARAILEGTARR